MWISLGDFAAQLANKINNLATPESGVKVCIRGEWYTISCSKEYLVAKKSLYNLNGELLCQG